MTTLVPTLPETAPFTAEQRAWLNGYLAGLFSRGPVDSAAGVNASAPAPASTVPPLAPLTILFGSQTGTAEARAKRAAKEAGKRGFAAVVLDLAQVDLARLAHERAVLLITSTYGDGEPPDNAKALHAALGAATGQLLGGLRFAVCALGDSNYVQFCQCGKDFDAHLERLGGTRVTARIDVDLDQDAALDAWVQQALAAFTSTMPALAAAAAASAVGAPSVSVVAAPRTEPASAPVAHGRNHPYSALVLATHRLSGDGSAKQVHHVAFALGDSALRYEAGDALGVFPHNCPELVAEILTLLRCDGEEAVPAPDGSTTSLRHALTELYDLGKPSPDLLALFGGPTAAPAASTAHVIDVLLARADVRPKPAVLVRVLKRLQPRLYSISSSPRAHPGEVHLTVGAVRYEAGARLRKGVCSTFLADRVVPGTSRTGIYVHANAAFRLPADASRPVIMIGPGTGIAPFRAFLHERRGSGANGRNWLFFGDQRSATDFLYREELLTLQAEGALNRLSLAWSRDQSDKVYVQTRMLEHAAELYAWLEDGAHLYVCGDASRMARDVDAALHAAIAQAGGKTTEQAAEYVQTLRAAKRYCRDVY
ncbi:sulfite reductase subunit alpha [Opitutus sp. ER46]|uniref:sulfite reductase subunit alpha n=1 Tax=Opitutus sp. ER46 TaxID=2161864 RepID=UPI000D305738|nr:sulfite reductase subunit alpha [Opitutus sp. ER46]PTX92495.1 sulfite reductase subunit alpha [Opitutus sp. ER46]